MRTSKQSFSYSKKVNRVVFLFTIAVCKKKNSNLWIPYNIHGTSRFQRPAEKMIYQIIHCNNKLHSIEVKAFRSIFHHSPLKWIRRRDWSLEPNNIRICWRRWKLLCMVNYSRVQAHTTVILWDSMPAHSSEIVNHNTDHGVKLISSPWFSKPHQGSIKHVTLASFTAGKQRLVLSAGITDKHVSH